MNLLKELRKMRTGILHDFNNFNFKVDCNKMIVKIDIDGKRSDGDIDDKQFKLDNDSKKLCIDFDGIVWYISTDVKVNIYENLNKIYCYFGAHKFKESGQEADELLENIKIARILLDKRKR